MAQPELQPGVKIVFLIRNKKTFGYIVTLTAAACWGTSALFVKLVLTSVEISPLSLAFWRDLFTFAAMLIILMIKQGSAFLKVRSGDLIWLVCLGAFGVGIFHIFWNLGIKLNGAAVATVQQSAMTVILAVAAWFLWKEPLNARKVAAVFLTFTGTVLISGMVRNRDTSLSVTGLVVGFCIPIFYASFSIFGKQLAGRYHFLTILTYGFGFGALALSPFQFFISHPRPVPEIGWLWFLSLIVFSTIIPFSLYTHALKLLDASIAGILIMIEIPFAFFFAYLFLGERLSLLQFGGAILITTGVLLVSCFEKSRTMGA
ncbi:MAG: hypothetical protein DRP87_14140 [Spirochaetes bacterium]|nr:MAG: hypothetical protein DRP87_14140 [Spirochaetota bacterium]